MYVFQSLEVLIFIISENKIILKSLTLREECSLRVFENRILRKIFRFKRDANGERRRFDNKERAL